MILQKALWMLLDCLPIEEQSILWEQIAQEKSKYERDAKRQPPTLQKWEDIDHGQRDARLIEAFTAISDKQFCLIIIKRALFWSVYCILFANR